MVAHQTIKVRPQVGTAQLLETLYRAACGNLPHVVGAIQQMIFNAADAKATAIDITIIMNELMRMADNGDGFSREGVQTYYSFFASHKSREDTSVIGQVGSGRSAVFSFAGGMIAFSRSADFQGVATLPLSKDHFLQILSQGDEQEEFDVTTVPEPPDFWPHEDGTGTVIEVNDINWAKVDITELRETLARILPRRIALMVSINGEKLDVDASKIEVQFHEDDPVLGAVSFEAYTAVTRDDLFIGSEGQLIEWKAFLKFIGRTWKELLNKDLLKAQSICHGDIRIQALGKYRGHDNSLLPEMLENLDLMQALITFLNEKVTPLVLEIKERNRPAQQQHVLLASVTSAFQPAFLPKAKDPGIKGTPTGPGTREMPPIDPLRIFPKRIEALPGSHVRFEAKVQGRNPTDPFTGIWNSAESGGVLSALDAPVITYTCGTTPGTYVLRVAVGEMEAEATIVILEEEKLQASPAKTQIENGGFCVFTARNQRSTHSNQYVWSLPDGTPEGITINRTEARTTSLDVSPSVPPGTYELHLSLSDDPSQVSIATFEVVTPTTNLFRIGDELYKIDVGPSGNRVYVAQADIEVGQFVILEEKHRDEPIVASVMYVEVDHPLLQEIESGTTGQSTHRMMRKMIIEHCVHAHLEACANAQQHPQKAVGIPTNHMERMEMALEIIERLPHR